MAADLAERLDEEIEERRTDVASLANVRYMSWFVEDIDSEGEDTDPEAEDIDSEGAEDIGSEGRVFASEEGVFARAVQNQLDTLVRQSGVFDYVIVIDASGHAVATNTCWPDGTGMPDALLAYLLEQDFSPEPWFEQASQGEAAMLDFHPVDVAALGLGEGRLAGGWYVGWAHPIEYHPFRPDETAGVVLALMNWEYIQKAVSDYGVRQLEEPAEGSVGEDIFESSYSWLWSSDADKIIAHPMRELYGQRVSELEGGALGPLVEAARSSEWGMYPDYEFTGVTKKAAFKHCHGPEEGGFGWVVGVGVNDGDIYAPVQELSNWLFTSSAVILALAVLFTFYVAHRTTRPIRELEAHTRLVGCGDLDTRLAVRSGDELGQLADSFNRMTTELKENREQLVAAEKEAAWREMARQVAHEIKNPLTPISLSASLLHRSWAEKSPEFDSILERTIELIQRQVENMREVVRDFYAFAGEHRDRRAVDVIALLDSLLELNSALADERGVRLHRPEESEPVLVRADPDELSRALLNLITNALAAMPDGGDLFLAVEAEDGRVRIEVRDTGSGIDTEVLDRLFEPYFTTRSSGTGLGLAIVRRIVEDLDGQVELRNVDSGPGAVAHVVLPRWEA